ncbi:hypothetical protein TrLO_g3725 [Triparma laevis f. longispina]|uniref:Uncharacterized protein n=1 Tax=Triparma laevis f. longispina TaxID=1714387 RepID=A0A9W7CKN7_9STRA|nr:hypothetical protein TrLO_g3725 [Triparma laevis f. longispina]
MLKRAFLLGLIGKTGAFSLYEPTPSPFFPHITEDTLKSTDRAGLEEQDKRGMLLDECSKHTTCGECASASSLFTSCRWCPKFGDVSCHVVGSSSNTCESDEQITDPDKCEALPATRKPVVILPGLIGTNLEAKLTDKPSVPSPVCSKNSDWFTVWISAYEVAPEFYKCMFDNIELHYNDEDETASNNPGVEVMAPDYGASIDAVMCLVPGNEKLCSSTTNWSNLVNAMEAKGYEVGKDLYSAPYDFRMGEKQFMAEGGDYSKLKGLVEEAYENNDGTPIVFISISYGGPFGAAFLTDYVDQAWKDKYIDSFISLSGVFNGAPMVVKQLLSGMPAYGLTWIDSVLLRDTMREWPSLAWLVPTWVEDDENNDEGNRVIMYTDVKNYTLSDVPELLENGGAAGAAAIKRKQNITPVRDPGVKVHCWFTEDMPTEWGYYQANDKLDKEPGVIPGLGDGTGDKHSLNRCESWENVEVVKRSGLCHSCYLSDEEVIGEIVELLVE